MTTMGFMRLANDGGCGNDNGPQCEQVEGGAKTAECASVEHPAHFLWDRFVDYFREKHPEVKDQSKYQVEWEAFKAGAGIFKEHTKAVAEFLNELYATLIDPLAEGPIKVADMQAALLAAARENRQALYDAQQKVTSVPMLGKVD